MSRALPFVVVAACVTLALVGVGAGAWLMLRRTTPGADDYVEARVGEIRLIYQAGYARFPAGRAGGHLDRLDIAATFPNLEPAGNTSAALDKAALVFLSIGPPERKVAPADLMSLLYARFLEADVSETEEGLLRRAFQDGTPYDGEDLYFDPPEGRAFAARCAKPTTPPDGLPETCIAAFRESGADIEARFTSALLPHWEKLAEGVRGLAKSMIAR